MRLFHRAVGLTLLGLTAYGISLKAAELKPQHKESSQLAQLVPSPTEPPLAGPAPPVIAQPVVPAPQFEGVPVQPPPQFEGAPLLAPGHAVGPPVSPAEPPVPVVSLSVRVIACAAAGQEIEYCICVKNMSPVPAHHVLVRDPLPSNTRFVRADPVPTKLDTEAQWYLGTLPGLCSKEIILVLQSTTDEDVKNCARVQFEHGQCVCTRIARLGPGAGQPLPGQPGRTPGAPAVPPEKEKEKPAPPTPPPQAKLELTVTGLKEQLVNQPVTYTITLTNPGTATARNAQVVAALPPGTAFVNASNEGNHAAGLVAWNVGALDAGASRKLEVTIKAQAIGEKCVKVNAIADGNLKAQAEACTSFKGAVGLGLRVETTRNPMVVGGETSYVIVVENQGSLPASNILVRTIIPNELTVLHAKAQVDNRLGAKLKEGQGLDFNPLVELGPGSTATFEVFAKAQTAGEARFQVILTADQLAAGPVISQQNTTIFAEAP